MFPTPTANGICGGTGGFQRLKELMGKGLITPAERRGMAAGNGGKLNPLWTEWLMGFPLFWTELTKVAEVKNEKQRRSKDCTANICSDTMRNVRCRKCSSASPPHRPESDQQLAGKCDDIVSTVPCSNAHSCGRLGEGASQNNGLCNMRQRFSPEGNESIENMQPGMPSGTWEEKRKETMGISHKNQRLPVLRQSIREKTCEGQNMFKIMWEQNGVDAAAWWYEEPVERITDGVPHRLERIRGLGNAQVPLCAATAWRILFERIDREE
jgi:hypothetical protein